MCITLSRASPRCSLPSLWVTPKPKASARTRSAKTHAAAATSCSVARPTAKGCRSHACLAWLLSVAVVMGVMLPPRHTRCPRKGGEHPAPIQASHMLMETCAVFHLCPST